MTKDAVVVGGGIVGCSTAWQLAERGLQVAVIERESEVGRGSTSRSTAIIRQRYTHPDAIALALEGLRTWERWPELVPADEAGRRAMLRAVGVLFLLPTGEPTTPELLARMRGAGVAVERLDRAALAAAFPALRFAADEAVEGLYEPEGGYVDDPARATRDAARAAARAGVTFHLGRRLVEVTTRWRSDGLEVRGVRLDDGSSIEAPIVVNCVGPHSGWLNLVALAACARDGAAAPGRRRQPSPALATAARASRRAVSRTARDRRSPGGFWARPSVSGLAR